MTSFISDPHKGSEHAKLFYQELILAGLTPAEIEAGPEKLSEERLKELKLVRKP